MSPKDLHQAMYDDFGPIIRMPGMFGRSDTLMIYEPEHFEKVYRTEGVWPLRSNLETFNHYRYTVRSDVFKNIGGLLSDQGETWYKMRSTVNPIMMLPNIVKAYIPDVDNVASDFVQKIKILKDDKGEMPDDFDNELNQWAMESIGVIALEQRLGVMSFSRNAESEELIKVDNFFSITDESVK